MNITSNLEDNILYVNSRYVSCNGGALGHPLVYYEIKENIDEVFCGYCGKHFIYKAES